MARRWVCPKAVFDGERLLRGVSIAVVDGRIDAIEDRESPRIDGVVTPGFVDLQVNGGGGVLFNADPTPSGLSKIAAAHRRFGTTRILPTVITDAPTVLEQACAAVLAARDHQDILGLHIEGPHIALSKRGTHAAKFIRPLDDHTIALVSRLRDANVPVVITLAPEAATGPQISALAQIGAIVFIGHSDANAAQVQSALVAGASGFTHLFNAMSQMQGREPGVVGAAINSVAHAGFIVDGHHVADEMMALALRARPQPDTTFLVSDAMPTVGGPSMFDLYGQTVRVQAGRLVNEEGNLAGAHLTLAQAVARCVSHVGTSLEDALRMAITVPMQVIRAAPAGLVGMAVEDVFVLNGAEAQPLSAKISPAK